MGSRSSDRNLTDRVLHSGANNQQPHRRCVSEILERAKAPFMTPVRALDALHIATAEWLQEELSARCQFWTHDLKQAQAVLSRGLEVRGA